MEGRVVEHQMRSLRSFSSTVTYSPNTTTNKKPALGGLEKAQALRSFLTATRDSSPAMMPSNQQWAGWNGWVHWHRSGLRGLIDQRNRFQRFWLYVINTLNITDNKARPL